MVISQNMNESEMSHRGSKSYFNNTLKGVKEQRVDDSCLSLPKKDELRCTLLAHESGYQTRSLSNLRYRRYSILRLSNVTKPIHP
jgi:hypothetical protein